MPPKKPPTQEDRDRVVREEGRVGKLYVTDAQDNAGLPQILEYIEFQLYDDYFEMESKEHIYYGYCPLFSPTLSKESIPGYSMRIDLSEHEPIVEMFQRKEK